MSMPYLCGRGQRDVNLIVAKMAIKRHVNVDIGAPLAYMGSFACDGAPVLWTTHPPPEFKFICREHIIRCTSYI